MSDRKAEVAALVNKNRIFDDPKTLESYSQDQSFTPAVKPAMVVKPVNVDEVQKIIQWANKTNTPLIPVSSGAPHFRGDTVPSVAGVVMVDLSDMKRIINVNRRNRMAIIEPGVTYADLQPALAKEGLRLSTSLMPKANKSVIASLLEREPRLTPRYQWSSMDPLRCLEIVWGDGNKLWSGEAGNSPQDLEKQWKSERRQIDPAGPSQIDYYRLLAAAQGSMGIATWGSVKCEVLPVIHKLFFVPGKNLEELTDFTYTLLRFRYADELFIMNNANLAYVLGDGVKQIQNLKEKVPAWVTVVGIAGRAELPEERVEFQEKDIREIAGSYNLELLSAVGGVEGKEALKILASPSRDPYWKLGYKGGCQEIFFITTLDRTPDFLNNMNLLTVNSGYLPSDIGVYLQPRHQGANLHCEFNLPYNPKEPQEAERVNNLYLKASEAMAEREGFFSRPYGVWSELAFRRNEKSTALLTKVKGIFDPNGIMNPGKLCFKVKASKER